MACSLRAAAVTSVPELIGTLIESLQSAHQGLVFGGLGHGGRFLQGFIGRGKLVHGDGRPGLLQQLAELAQFGG